MRAKANNLVVRLSQQYIQDFGIDEHDVRLFSIEEAQLSADLYDTMEHTPHNDTVKESYNVFLGHLVQHFELILNEQFTLIDGQGIHNYANSDELRDDIAKYKIVYLPTYSNDKTYSEITEDHPLSGNIEINGINYCLNDIFRIVHDFYGHGMGHSFGPKGEHYAWLEHRKMFPASAHLALWCETRGQSSWVNFGKHIRESEQNIPLAERPFAQQKCGIVPAAII